MRRLAEFYRELLGFTYRPGDALGERQAPDWLVLCDEEGGRQLAFQQVGHLEPPTWPDESVPKQLHLDMAVGTAGELEEVHERVLELGARLLYDRFDDPQEPLRVYADPAGHPFCVFVSPLAAG